MIPLLVLWLAFAIEMWMEMRSYIKAIMWISTFLLFPFALKKGIFQNRNGSFNQSQNKMVFRAEPQLRASHESKNYATDAISLWDFQVICNYGVT